MARVTCEPCRSGDVWAKEYFGGKCPYTGKKCESWECSRCQVEKNEKEWMEEKEEEMRRDEFPIVEEYTNQKIRERLNQIIKEAEEHIQSVKSSDPTFQGIYEMGESHILDLVKLHLKELEEKKCLENV